MMHCKWCIAASTTQIGGYNATLLIYLFISIQSAEAEPMSRLKLHAIIFNIYLDFM